MSRDVPLGPALAMLDLGNVPQGLRALDRLAKEASVTVLSAGTIQGGRYLVLFAGEVEPVQRSFHRASEGAGAALVDSVLLPFAEERIAPAIQRGTVRWPAPGDTLGVLQNGTPPTLLAAVDAALKGANVELVELRVGDGLGGQAIASVWGETPDVEAALELADGAARRGRASGYAHEIIRNADDAVGGSLGRGTRFFQEWRG
jgi:microcompartment protein CcmL/EutN